MAAALSAAGCGGDEAGVGAARAAAPVILDVGAPADSAVVYGAGVELRGSVQPAGATVRVLGRRAVVRGGSFRADVPLEPGANVIDVIATAPGREPAMNAVRVTREMPVPVPDLEGATVEEAHDELARLGLDLEAEEHGGLLDPLLPGEPGVCDQEPPAGEDVRRGTTVRVIVAERC